MAIVSPSIIPTDKDFDVTESSFFQNYDTLPSPDEVRAKALEQHQAGTQWGPKNRPAKDHPRPCPAVFESMGLFVKWGRNARIEEGQTLYMIRRFLKEKVPVPEIYGWRTEGEDVFLYMEAIHANTLEESWPEIEEASRIRICNELRAALDNLRQLIRQDPADRYIGTVSRTRLEDRGVSQEFMKDNGPFPSVAHFHDWFTSLPTRFSGPVIMGWGKHRQDLPDESKIVFTQGDLHISNILLSKSDPVRLVAIIDWEQSGWLPEYWEERKAKMTASCIEDWYLKYIPMFLDSYPNSEEAWHYYRTWMGAY